MSINLPITSRSSANALAFSDVYTNDVALVTEIDARDDNYQTILTAQGFIKPDQTAATLIVGSSTSNTTAGVNNTMLASGASIDHTAGTSMSVPIPMIYFDDADYTVASKTQKLRLRAQVNANATAWSSVTATFGLYPVTFAGGTDILTVTLGTVVSGSTVAIANPSASTTNQGNSGDFTIPSDGQFCLGVVTSATLTNNAVALLTAQLQTRWV